MTPTQIATNYPIGSIGGYSNSVGNPAKEKLHKKLVKTFGVIPRKEYQKILTAVTAAATITGK